MPTAATLDVKINSTLDESGFDQAEQRTKGLGGKLGTALGTAGGFLLANAVQAVAGNVGSLVSAGLDFEAQMANVNSIAQLSATELQNLSSQVLELTNNPGITDGPAALAAGLYQVSSSGFSGADGIMVLEQAAMAASAGLTTTETAATAITAALNAYGLEASSAGDISDMMFQTVNDGVISFEQLASNMGNVLPVASSLGVGFDEVGAAYAQMTLAGVNASAAETQIAAVMRSALNPTESLTAAVQEAGFASATAAIESEGLAGFLGIVSEASGGSEEALFEMLGTTEAMNAALLLGGENLDEYIEEIERMGGATEGAGATQKALQKQMQSASFQIAKAKQQVQVAATMFMGLLAPGIAAAAKALTSFISGGLIPFGKVIASAFSGGNAFRELVDALPEPLQRTVGAMGSVAEAVGDVARAFGEGGLAGAFQTLTDGGELQQIGTALSAIADEAWNALVAGFNAIPWGTIWDLAVQPLLAAAADAVVDIGAWTINVAAPAVISWLGDAATGIWDWLKGQMGIGGGTTGDGTGGPESDRNMDISDWTLNVAAPTVAGWIKDAAADAWPYIKQAAGWAAEALYDFGAWTLTVGAPQLGGWIADQAGNLWDWLKGEMGLGGGSGDPNSGSPGQVANGANVTLGSWILDTAVPTITGWIADAAADAWPHIKSAVGWAANQLFDFGSWSLNTAAPTLFGWINTNKGDVWNAIKTAAGWGAEQLFEFGAWTLNVAAPALGGWAAEIGGNFWGWLQGQLFGGGGSGDPNSGSPGQVANASIDLGIATAISDAVSAEISELTGMVGGWKDDILAAVADIVPDSIPDLTLPDVNINIDAISGTVDAVIETITGLATDLWGAVKDLLGAQDAANAAASAPPAWSPSGTGGGTTVRPGAQYAQDPLDPGDQARPRQIGRAVQPPPPMVIPAPDTSAFDRGIAQLPMTMARGMAGAVSSAQAGTSLIGSVVGSGMTTMVSVAASSMAMFTSAVMSGMVSAQGVTASAMGAMVGAVASGSGAIIGAISGAFGQVVGIVSSTMGQVPGIVAGALGAAAASAFSSGAAIGQGLAAGMNSTLGAVQAAAAALASAASAAAAARLAIASPSKVFMQMGQQVGDGFVIGMQSRYGAAGSAGQGLADSSIPNTAAALRGRGSGSGQTLVIITPDSENFSEIARKARRGGDFAELLPQLLRQGAY